MLYGVEDTVEFALYKFGRSCADFMNRSSIVERKRELQITGCLDFVLIQNWNAILLIVNFFSNGIEVVWHRQICFFFWLQAVWIMIVSFFA